MFVIYHSVAVIKLGVFGFSELTQRIFKYGDTQKTIVLLIKS